LYSISRGFTDICYIKQDQTLRKKWTWNSEEGNPGGKLHVCIKTGTRFSRDFPWDWDPRSVTLSNLVEMRQTYGGHCGVKGTGMFGKRQHTDRDGSGGWWGGIFSLNPPSFSQCITFALCIPKLFVSWYKTFMRLLLTEYNTTAGRGRNIPYRLRILC
jgi:hypothetical protein